MDVSESYSGDELIPESCLESEWIDEDEVFAILKQWETRGGGGVRGNSKAAAAATGYGNTAGSGHILLNQSFGNENNISVGSSIPGKLETLSECVTDRIKNELLLLDDIDSIECDKRLLNPNSGSQRFVDTGTFTRPKKRIETGIPNSPLAADNNNTLSSSHTEFPSGGSPLLNVQIGGPVTPSSLATPSALASSTTGNRLLMQRSWLQDVSPPCSIMNSMEYSANEKITSSLITSGDFSSVGCLLNAGDDNANGSMPNVGNASYNGYNLYSVIEDRQRLENLCLDEESTLTKDCNISRTDLNAIESVSGVSTMQNSYESSGRTGALVGGKSSFEEESSPPPPPTSTGAPTEEERDAGKELINTTITTGVTAPNDTFELPEAEAERLLAGKLLLNGGGTYDARRPRNFNTYRKPRSSLNQTFEEVPHVDADTTVVLPAAGQTFVAPKPVLDKHAVMNSTFGIVGDEQIGGAANGHGTFVRNRTLNNEERDDVRLINLTLDTVEPSITPPPAVPFDRTFKRRPRNGTFIGGEDEVRHLPFDSPLRPTVVGGGGAGPAAEPQLEDEAEPHGQRTPNGTYNQPQQHPANTMLVQSTPFHGPSARAKVAPELEDLSPIGPETQKTTPTSGLGRTMVRRSRNLEQDLRNITHEVVGTAEPAADMLLELETDDFDVQIRRLPSATATTGTGTGTDISNFLDAEKRISLQHFEEFEKSILESEHSGIDFDEMLNSLTADVRRSDEASDKLRQSLDNIKKRHSRINLEKQQQDEMKRKLHQQQQQQPAEAQCDNKLADSLLSKSGGGSSSMCSSSGSERLLNRRSRYNEDVHLNLSPQQQQQQQQQSPAMNATVIMANGGSEEGPAVSTDPVPTNSEVETYDRKNRDRFKTIRLGRRRDDSLGAVLPDVDQELAGPQPLLNGSGEDSGLSSSSSAFSRVDHNAAKMAGGPPSLANGGSRMAAGNGSNLPTMKTEPSGDDDEAVFKKPQAIQPSTMMQQPSGLARPGESRLRSTLSKPRYYGAAGPLQGTIGGIQRKDLTLPLGNKSSSADCLEQREEDDQYLLQQPRLSGDKSLQQQQQPTSRLATMSKLGGGSGGLLGTGRYSQFGLANKQLQLQQNQTVAGQPMGAPALKSPMGTKSKSYHSLTFAQANNSSGYGGSSGNLSKLHGSSALQLKLKHNSSNTELSGGVQMRTASGLAKTSRLGLIRPSSGYFSYSTHRKHPDSDNESVNSLSSSSASSRGSLYRVDSQSIANGAQPPQFASATRTNSVEDVSGTSSSGNGLLTKLNGTGAGMGPGVLSAYASIEPPLPKNNPPVSSSMPAAPTTTGLKQPTAATGGAKPSGLRPPSAIRPPTVRSGLPRPTSYIRR
uniref:Serine-rich adhesin for platelets n=1 Tax=Anopheles gambiae TaxID=7165 RepID=A0ABK8FGP0_ANOGA